MISFISHSVTSTWTRQLLVTERTYMVEVTHTNTIKALVVIFLFTLL